MKTCTLFLFLLFLVGANASAAPADSAKVPLREISYHSLDSLIRSNEYTAVYYWPSWCSACYGKLPALFDLMRQKKSITFISINDPNSRPIVPKTLLRNSDIVKGYFQIERHGREPLFSVNDRKQQRYFSRYYVPSSSEAEAEMIRRFLLFDRSGKLLYSSKTDYLDNLSDSLAVALAPYQ